MEGPHVIFFFPPPRSQRRHRGQVAMAADSLCRTAMPNCRLATIPPLTHCARVAEIADLLPCHLVDSLWAAPSCRKISPLPAPPYRSSRVAINSRPWSAGGPRPIKLPASRSPLSLCHALRASLLPLRSATPHLPLSPLLSFPLPLPTTSPSLLLCAADAIGQGHRRHPALDPTDAPSASLCFPFLPLLPLRCARRAPPPPPSRADAGALRPCISSALLPSSLPSLPLSIPFRWGPVNGISPATTGRGTHRSWTPPPPPFLCGRGP